MSHVFISYIHDNENEVQRLCNDLTRHGVKVWLDRNDIEPGTRWQLAIRRAIQEGAFFIACFSKEYNERAETYMNKELTLAIERLRKLPQDRAWFIPVKLNECEIPDRDIGAGETLQDLQFVELYNDWNVGIQRILQAMQLERQAKEANGLWENAGLKVTFITDTEGIQGRLLDASFDCYESLFPDESMRDDPADIMGWINEFRVMAKEIPQREIYAVLHKGEYVAGMTYLTAYLDSHWCFGNYFGLRREWRKNRGAEVLFSNLQEHLRSIDPDIKGIVFELEYPDFEYLEKVAEREQIGGHDDEEYVFLNLRRLRRLMLYQNYHAWVVLGANGQPLPYWQPAMGDDLNPEDELQLILMIRFLQGTDPPVGFQLKEVLDFIYDDLYGDAFGDTSAVSAIPGFRSYIASIKARAEQGMNEGWQLGMVRVKKPIRHLLYRARRECYSDNLDL